METTEVDEATRSLQVEKIRTDTSDSRTEVGQDGGTGVAHLTLHGELSFDVDLSEPSSNHKGNNAGKKEDGREDNDADEFREHADTHTEDGVEVVRNCAVNCNHR